MDTNKPKKRNIFTYKKEAILMLAVYFSVLLIGLLAVIIHSR